MQYQNADTKSLADMAYISVVLEHSGNKPQMVEVKLRAPGQEEQAPGDGTIRGVHGNRDPESWGLGSQQGAFLKIFSGNLQVFFLARLLKSKSLEHEENILRFEGIL